MFLPLLRGRVSQDLMIDHWIKPSKSPVYFVLNGECSPYSVSFRPHRTKSEETASQISSLAQLDKKLFFHCSLGHVTHRFPLSWLIWHISQLEVELVGPEAFAMCMESVET